MSECISRKYSPLLTPQDVYQLSVNRRPTLSCRRNRPSISPVHSLLSRRLDVHNVLRQRDGPIPADPAHVGIGSCIRGPFPADPAHVGIDSCARGPIPAAPAHVGLGSCTRGPRILHTWACFCGSCTRLLMDRTNRHHSKAFYKLSKGLEAVEHVALLADTVRIASTDTACLVGRRFCE